MKFEIRRIKSGEAQLYREIRIEALRESPAAFCSTHKEALERSPESWRLQANQSASGSDRGTFFGFEPGSSKPEGLVAIYRDTTRTDSCDLIQMWIAPDFRTRGLGAELVAHALAWAKEKQFRHVRTEVLPTNESVVRFYEKVGFQIENEHPGDNTMLIYQFEKDSEATDSENV